MMNRLCAAPAILLAGWYLIAPPMYDSYTGKHQFISVQAYPELPLASWDKFGLYPTRKKCEAQKRYNFADEVKAGPGKSARDKALWNSSRLAICVRADDPRLKRH
jgi:hypothetical protein